MSRRTTSRRAIASRAAALATAAVTAVSGAALLAPTAAAQGSSAPGSSTPGSPAPGSSNDPAPAFYVPPAQLPAENGAVIKSEQFPLAGALPQIPGIPTGGPLDADAWRIMYRSVGAKGDPIAVTGTYMKPRKPWTGGGERPLALIAPGTVGQGDACAPSKSFQNVVNVGADPFALGVGYEIIQAYALLDRGYAVAVTDYEGLGTPGVHTYVHRESSARAVLDAARAARSLPQSDSGADPRTVAIGYSQGGGSTAAAAELQPTYAPDVNLVGAAAGSPPADLSKVVEQIDGTGITGAIGYSLNSLADTYPEFAERLNVHMNDRGEQMLRAVRDQCIGETALHFGLQHTRDYTDAGVPAGRLVDLDPVAFRYVDMQRIGRLKPQAPVRVLAVQNDDVIPAEQSRQLGRDWCALGATVDLTTDTMPPVAPGFVINHAAPMLTQLTGQIQYLADRVDGRPAPSNCGTY